MVNHRQTSNVLLFNSSFACLVMAQQVSNRIIIILDLNVYRKNNEEAKPLIQDWKLVYSPNNTIFEELVDNVTKSLSLDGYVGVATPKEVEAAMVAKQLVAGIDFHHLAVNTIFHRYFVIRFLQILPSFAEHQRTAEESFLFAPFSE